MAVVSSLTGVFGRLPRGLLMLSAPFSSVSSCPEEPASGSLTSSTAGGDKTGTFSKKDGFEGISGTPLATTFGASLAARGLLSGWKLFSGALLGVDLFSSLVDIPLASREPRRLDSGDDGARSEPLAPRGGLGACRGNSDSSRFVRLGVRFLRSWLVGLVSRSC